MLILNGVESSRHSLAIMIAVPSSNLVNGGVLYTKLDFLIVVLFSKNFPFFFS